MKIVGISGNPYANSTNLKVLEKVGAELESQGHTFEVIHEVKDLPLFNPQTEYQEHYDIVNQMRAKVKEADFLVIVSPEYMGGVPAILKNALEWMLSEATLMQKPTAFVIHSPIGKHAVEALNRHLSIMGATLKEEWQLLISYNKRIERKDGWFQDDSVNDQLKAFIQNVSTYHHQIIFPKQ
ncbi:NADPH-dependent FMN reductase [Macrococcus animalis]|uniref:NADPH-dependent FMN reductase n=1 Tax=Macrococcus animalis TaxID=3395467 RepID=UPI0039BE0E81